MEKGNENQTAVQDEKAWVWIFANKQAQRPAEHQADLQLVNMARTLWLGGRLRAVDRGGGRLLSAAGCGSLLAAVMGQKPGTVTWDSLILQPVTASEPQLESRVCL